MVKPVTLLSILPVLGACIMHSTGDANSVSVPNVTSAAHGLYWADPHCGQFGKVAEFKSMTGASTATYECVPGAAARPK